MSRVLFFICMFLSKLSFTQDSLKLTLSGVADAYYSFNTNNDATTKPLFVYSHNKLKQPNINMAFLKLNASHNKYRANLAVMAGTYVNTNLAAEPNWAKPIYEANVGIKLGKKNIWLDAGIMPSHIGFESANSQDCYTLTRSILADNSPYYETGAKISYTNAKENLTMAVLVLNGWQRIARPIGYNGVHIGTQLTYKKRNNTFNYSTYFGGENANAFRTYHNFYWINESFKKFAFVVGYDMGTEKNKTWNVASVIGRYTLNEKTKVAARFERFSDPQHILYSFNNELAMPVVALSSNIDFQFYKKCMLRVEWKSLYAQQTTLVPTYTTPIHNITAGLSIGF